MGQEAGELILVGHTHIVTDRMLPGSRAVNPGSVSLPRQPDDLARWAFIDAGDDGYSVEFRSVPYALDDVVADLERQHHPASAWLREKMTAEARAHG